MMRHLFTWTIALFLVVPTFAQNQTTTYADVEPDKFDYGKMWTFEHAPLDYFEEAYGFRPTEEWLEKARMSALRFSSYCSASFISPNGLILTNYHCSQGEVANIQQEGEDLEASGFYAKDGVEERKAPGLFVRQLKKIADISQAVKEGTEGVSAEERAQLIQANIEKVKGKYGTQEGWEGLELDVITYYNGGKYSLYGYKRYDDIRLVFIPELQIGFYGGDPDNFTYPRYNLDFTIWRAYEDGKPVNSEDFYFPINPDGVEEGTTTFLIGNPGRTERYRTVAQLEFDRDYRYKMLLEMLSNRVAYLRTVYEENPNAQLNSQILSYSNGEKAYTGILNGMHDPYLMGKKVAMEKQVKTKSAAVKSGNDYWAELAEKMEALGPHTAEVQLLAPNGLTGNIIALAHRLQQFREALDGEASEEQLEQMRGGIMELAGALTDEQARAYFTLTLQELAQFAEADDSYLEAILQGRTPKQAAMEIMDKTKLSDPETLEKWITDKTKKIQKGKDPFLEFAATILPPFREAVTAFRGSGAERDALEEKIGTEIYNIYGLSIPPDATSSLRIADGQVRSYMYNGTKAPINTTFFGLYDRHYSHGQEFPWSLPNTWLPANPDILNKPVNFVSTNDSIGGNSGSPVINTKGQLVGLLFDGNIQSLSGNFIYDSTANRSVSVHVGGILAALQYVYNAQDLLQELGQ